MTEARTVRSGFLRSCERFPDRPALAIGGRALTYAELHARAASIAATLQRRAPDAAPPLTAVLGQRSETLYASVLGALLRGQGYVPLNPAFPAARSRAMLERSECSALVVDAGTEAYLEQVLEGVERRLVLVLPDRDDAEPLAKRLSRHEIVTAAELEPANAWRATPVETDAIAYLLFTSGSTGVPKGVMVAHRNVSHFLDVMTERYRITEADRLSQLAGRSRRRPPASLLAHRRRRVPALLGAVHLRRRRLRRRAGFLHRQPRRPRRPARYLTSSRCRARERSCSSGRPGQATQAQQGIGFPGEASLLSDGVQQSPR